MRYPVIAHDIKGKLAQIRISDLSQLGFDVYFGILYL